MRWLIIIVVIATGLSAWGGHQLFQSYLDSSISLDSTTQYEVPAGSSLGAIALDLHQRGWLERPRWFVWYARSRGDESRIRAGEYELQPDLSPRQLLALLVGGKVVQHAFTIIEGSTFAELRKTLAAEPQVTHTIGDMADAEIMEAMGHEGVHPEGRFLPETYYYTRGTTDIELLRRANELLEETLARLWDARDENIPLQEPDEALILASIIEKETALASERPQIAGVFTRRLQKRMRLQSDPTVIYGIGPSYDGDIRKKDLTTDTPYNTYTRHGLPPTPIAMAGAAAIEAALHPAPGDTLYFVATGNGDGSHYFSTSIEEHNRAVQRYLARLRKRQ
ncbi:MAG: endolytic transglycosylase MltG [Gammaproteobacteria bacterium]|nr:endolytic transglycosylase MltG [Gammaproteobacteria bacterium]NNF61827.1 endolytic transglycosylase MltG [Gammaproteobacteria bacterium]